MRFVRVLAGVSCAVIWITIWNFSQETTPFAILSYISAILCSLALSQLLPLYHYERNITKYFMKQTDLSAMDSEDKIVELQTLSNELMTEKKNLEEKVRQRTAEIERANQKLRDYDKSKTDFF